MNLIIIGILAFIGGLAVALQARVMSNVETRLTVWGSISINFIVGSLLMIVILAFLYLIDLRNKARFDFNVWANQARELQWWELTSGFFGIVIVGIVGFSTSRLGVLTTLAFFFVGQIFMAVILDHFGFFTSTTYPISLNKILALGFFFLGLFFFLRS